MAASTWEVSVDGAKLAADIIPQLAEVVVEDALHLPDAAVLRFFDSSKDIAERGGFKVGAAVKVSVVIGTSPAKVLFDGECTALEIEFGQNTLFTAMRCLDKSHRLNIGRATKTYEKQTASDIVRSLAQECGLTVGKVDSTEVKYDHVTRANETAAQFIRRLAFENGRQLHVGDGKVNFVKPLQASDGPAPGGQESSSQAIQLALGTSVRSLSGTITAAEQVPTVTVRGWDPQQKKAVTADVKAKTGSAVLSTDPGKLASKFQSSAKLVLASPAYTSQPLAKGVGETAGEQLGSGFAELMGETDGNPALRAGVAMSLAEAGKDFDGKYVISQTRHLYDKHLGYRTEFVVAGRQDRTLLGLARGGAGGATAAGTGLGGLGVVPAIVTQTKDELKQGRVRVSFPWMDDQHESGWARVATPGGSKNRGLVALPAVDDEVLVAFEHGDPNRPIVLGGFWNGKDNLPDYDDDLVKGGKAMRSALYTAKSKLVLDDKDGKEAVHLGLRDGTYAVTIDKGGTTIKVTSDGKVEITGKQDITITSAQGKMSLEANGDVSIKSKTGNVNVEGLQAVIKGSAGVTLKGAKVGIN